MKKTKVIIPALGILLLSTAASVTGTVAWFSMNNAVTATGMRVQARVETGIVISTAANGSYGQKADLAQTEATELYPSSTANFTNWYHNNSNSDSVATGTGVVGEYESVSNSTSATYYTVNEFYIRSSAYEEMTVNSLNVKSVSVTKADKTASTDTLSKALRVGVLFEGDTATNKYYIFAPRLGAGESIGYTVAGTTAVTAISGTLSQAENAPTFVQASAITKIPGNTANGVSPNENPIHVYVYVWFEGEDPECRSINITASIEDLLVSVDFNYA